MRAKVILLVLASACTLAAHEGSHEQQISEMRAGATTLLSSLDATQKKQAHFPFADAERENWHFVPMSDRKGLRIGDLSAGQVPMAYAFLGTGLTSEGLLTASSIMSLEQYLAVKENNPLLRDPQKYFFSVFGDPKARQPWGWRFEGHHLSLNYTILDDSTLSYTPAFFGTNPAELPDGPRKGSRPLGEIEDAARALAVKIHGDFPTLVFSANPPRDIVTSQERVAGKLRNVGLSSDHMPAEEVKALRALIRMAVGQVTTPTPAQAAQDPIAKAIFADDAKLWFAWAGSLKKGEAHYFRVQADDVLVEYANTQNKANHAHLVVRCPDRDFGRDLLKEHVEKEH